jgi:hypothetical protein
MATRHNSGAYQPAPQPTDKMTSDDWIGILGLATPALVYGVVLAIGLATDALEAGGF